MEGWKEAFARLLDPRVVYRSRYGIARHTSFATFRTGLSLLRSEGGLIRTLFVASNYKASAAAGFCTRKLTFPQSTMIIRARTCSNFLLTSPGNTRGVERLATLIVRVLGLAPVKKQIAARSGHLREWSASIVGSGVPPDRARGSSLARLEDSIALFQKTELQCLRDDQRQNDETLASQQRLLG